MLNYVLNHADTFQFYSLLVLLAISLLLLALTTKWQIERVKRFKKCEPIETGRRIKFTFYTLTPLDMSTLFMLYANSYFLMDLFMVRNTDFYALLGVLVVGLGLSIKNKVIEKQQSNCFFILGLLKDDISRSSDEIIEACNREIEAQKFCKAFFSNKRILHYPDLEGKRFYKALAPLLRREMISNYSEDALIEDKILYRITTKGKNNYLDYLELQYEELEKERHYLGKITISQDGENGKAYDEVCRKLQSIRKEIALLTSNHNSEIKII